MTYFEYDARPCGAGKTYDEFEQILQEPARYLLAVEKRERMDEVVPALEAAMARTELGSNRPEVLTIRSCAGTLTLASNGTLRQTGSRNVRQDVEALPTRFPAGSNVIVVVTHEALRLADLRAFEHWHLRIDETPTAWDRQTLAITVSRDILVERYDLTQITKSRSVITARSDRAKESVSDIARDSIAQGIAVLHQRILSGRCRVTTDLASWDELDIAKSFSWSSVWGLDNLFAFSSVRILAHAFDQSVTYRIWCAQFPDITWTDLGRTSPRRHARRKVLIHFFARRHEASRSLWSSIEGQMRLLQVAGYVSSGVSAGDHIWTCNKGDEPLLCAGRDKAALPGQHLTPRQAGSNTYANRSSATALLTCKPSRPDIAEARELGIEPELIVDAREREVMVQFATRTSVRDPQSTQTVRLYVYDWAQAEHLGKYFDATGYCMVELVEVDLGFLNASHDSRSGRKSSPRLTASQEEARGQRQREKTRERVRRHRKRKAAAGHPPDGDHGPVAKTPCGR
ncbi:MAG: hypothetical protein EON58_12510 [Alphaproteobacteria bacterium]|nr:MAG: hypothetical protein EON58_12510 [Alphaproteobacteria bacterium]